MQLHPHSSPAFPFLKLLIDVTMAEKARSFNDGWIDKYFVRQVQGKPVCLICKKTQSLNKQSNISWHYVSIHSEYDSRYPPGTERRKERLKKLISQVEEAEKMLRENQQMRQLLPHWQALKSHLN